MFEPRESRTWIVRVSQSVATRLGGKKKLLPRTGPTACTPSVIVPEGSFAVITDFHITWAVQWSGGGFIHQLRSIRSCKRES